MRRFTLVALLSVAALGGCGSHYGYDPLLPIEIDYLSEDVLDLMAIVFQAGENAFVGDSVAPEDIVDPGGPGNDFTATYDLPEDNRVGLGFGSGRVALQVIEDGFFNEEPLLFSISTTTALEVEITYELRYDGETLGGRFTEVDLLVSVIATRASALDPFEVDYWVDGQTFLGFTFTEITTQFFSPGRPRDGIIPGVGDGEGIIDDPEVDAGVFDFDLDWDDADTFRAEGEVGICCWFDERFFLDDAF
jgi:hypothetical protein